MDSDDIGRLQPKCCKSTPKVSRKKIRMNNIKISCFEVSPKTPDNGDIIAAFFLDQGDRDPYCPEVLDQFAFRRDEANGVFYLQWVELPCEGEEMVLRPMKGKCREKVADRNRTILSREGSGR